MSDVGSFRNEMDLMNWVHGLGSTADAFAIARVALAAARTTLPIWERAVPDIEAPRIRLSSNESSAATELFEASASS